jgi:RNA polymerase sigma factor (sigma-70 family)
VRTEDGELVRETLASNWASFSELVSRYRDAVYGVAYHHLGDPEDAQDAAQEAFVHAFLKLQQLREPGKFGPWLRQITSRVCLDLLRRRGDQAVSLDATSPSDSCAAADDTAERVAARMVVREALSRLSAPARLAVTLYYVNGYSHGEIAHFLGEPVNTVRSRLHRAKRRLREEMIGMVSDVLHEDRPDPEFTKRVIEESMRRGQEAYLGHAAVEALERYDEALAAAEQLEPGEEQLRLKMAALWGKGRAAEFPRGCAEAIVLYEQALAIGRELGDRAEQANMMVHLGVTCSNARREEDARQYYDGALGIYRELGDAGGQGRCLLWLASQQMEAKEAAAARAYLEEALPLLERSEDSTLRIFCRSALDLLIEVGDERFASLSDCAATCQILIAAGTKISTAGDSGWGDHSDRPAALSIEHPFWQISHLGTILDASVPVGGSWSGDAFSYSWQPLKAVVTVKNGSEHVTVPAGSFSECLLTEQVTRESGLLDEAPEGKRKRNREVLCGTRRAWWAPGVGLVQLHVERGDGSSALIQLCEYSIEEKSRDYLPLAIGNAWSYSWTGAAPEWVAKESFQVREHDGDKWYLEHIRYVYKISPEESATDG